MGRVREVTQRLRAAARRPGLLRCREELAHVGLEWGGLGVPELGEEIAIEKCAKR